MLVKDIFFLLTLYNSLKNFLSGTSNAIFSLLYLFSTVIGEEAENGLLGRAPSQDEYRQVLSFFVKMLHLFFVHLGTLFREKSETDTFDWKHL